MVDQTIAVATRSALPVSTSIGTVETSAGVSAAWSIPVIIRGFYNFILSGTWAGTVFHQKSYDNGVTYVDVASYTTNIADQGEEPEEGVLHRWGFKAGGWLSGTAVGRL